MTWPSAVATTTLPLATAGEDVTGEAASYSQTFLRLARSRHSFTLIDLRPIRPLVFGARHKALDADLVRVIHGFDSLLVLSGSNPSQNL
jgi:hypothetical protein